MRVIIAAAGTGGHINPGIAIANKIKEEEKNSEIIFIGTSRGLENDLVPRAGYELKQINAYGINRSISFDNVKRLFKTIHSVSEAKKIIKEFKPDIIIGTGGYICVSTCLAAEKLNIPFILHESNAFPGMAVKLLAKKAQAVLLGFEDAKERLPQAKRIEVTGSPSKAVKMNLSDEQIIKIRSDLGFFDDGKLVLAFGGSLGAKSINDSLMEIIKDAKNKSYQLIWSAGAQQYKLIDEELKSQGKDINKLENVKIVPYIYNMGEVMNAVDLVVCRSGAMTITEISNVGKPAIFIPYPYATENHQEFNARVLEKVGAAKIILDKDINADKLNDAIIDIISDDKKIIEMGENAQKVSIKNVEDNIYNVIKDVLKK